MSILKKRPVALLITIVVIVLSTFFSVHRTLGAKCREISDSFYIGVHDTEWGTTRRSISSQLDNRCNAANGAASLAANYPGLEDLTSALRLARAELMDARGAHEKFVANQLLEKAYGDLINALEKETLSDSDKDHLDSYSSSFKGAQGVIESSGYNELVRAFERETLEVFPTNLLKNVTYVQVPELFA